MKKFRFLFLGLIFLGIVVSSFIYISQPVHTQEIKPVDQGITITDLTIKEDHEVLKVDITFPLIQGVKDKQVEKKINQIIREDILNFKNQLQMGSEEYLQSATRMKNGR